MSLQDKETMEPHGLPLFYAESEKKKDAADYELLKVLKEDDRRFKYKNNVVIVGGDHLHVKSLSGISCSFLLLPSKQEKIQFDRAKRIASGKMDSYRDGQRAKKGRKEQGRKARKQEQKLDEAETDFEMGMEAEVVLNINQEDSAKKNKNKKGKGFKEEKKQTMEGDEEEGEL
ncbi:hypothetical protein F2Q69_00043944 [Brassica cretica]|uniref:Uncharacterized protein n=1 Tax=Brassica cretica TaxID=69181 RepID=A0A8S9NLH6_BRACR|nr:hypothetical protein F2Q69_00043944 [Brassica cretica]